MTCRASTASLLAAFAAFMLAVPWLVPALAIELLGRA